MSLIILNVDEVRRTLSASGGAFVVHDKEVDIVRFAINSGFADIVIDGQVALRVMYQRPGETEVRAQTLTYYDTDGLRNYYDWQLLSADLAEKGTITVALCILRTDNTVEEWHTTPCQIRVLNTIHTDDSDEGDETITPTVAQRVAVLESMIQRIASGAPTAVGSVSEMTDTEQIYVLSTDGMWYYYDGSAWVAGGEYGAVSTDRTLSTDGIPADAKTVGDEFTNLKSAFNNLLVTDSQIGDAVTLSNIISSNTILPISGGLEISSGSDSIVTYTCATGAEVSPYAYKPFENPTSGKYLWGFKYRLTKLDPLLENPENIRMHMGASAYFDDPVVYDEWINFAEIATVELTRIRFSIRNFSTAPTEDSFKFETKEMYLYDVTNVDTSMIEYIIEEQETNYKDGTVTYGDVAEYFPDTSLSVHGKVADSKAVGDAVSPLAASVSQLLSDTGALNDSVNLIKSSMDGIAETATATLTDLNPNTNIFTSGMWRYISTVDDVLSFVPANPSDSDVYGSNTCNLGEGKYLVGFKYRLSKIDPLLDDPQSVRVILGFGTSAKTYTYTNFEYNAWSEFAEIADVDLTRVYFSVRGFPTPPTDSQFKLEIKDYYIYNIDSVDSRLYDIIIDQQNELYKSGTVIYKSGFPSKDIVNSEIQINVKSFGVKGDGVTDDTNAINAVFSKMKGNFYFPEGTYKISGTISLPSESMMFGDGDKTIIDMYSCDNLKQCVFRGGNSIYPYILVVDNSKLHGFKLIGNNTTQERRHAGILVMDAENCFISNLAIYNINYFASQTDPNVNAYGVCVLRSYRVYIDHCYVEQCGYECIGIADSSHHCVVSNCITKNGWRTCIQVHRGAYDVDIVGNQMIQDAQAWDACFTLHGLQDENLVRNLRIENNTFKTTVPPRTRNEPYASVVQLMSYCDGLWFVNNRVEAGDRNLAAEASITHLIMVGNLFQCSDTSDYRIRIVSEYPIIIGNILENTDGTTQRISATAVKVANIGFD